MTRIAPRSTDGIAERSSDRMVARWRVGAQGALEIVIETEEAGGHARGFVTFNAERFVVEGQVALSGRVPSREIAFRANPSRRVGTGFSLTICERSGDDPVIVTDLPERLGLTGGTYALEQCVCPNWSQT